MLKEVFTCEASPLSPVLKMSPTHILEQLALLSKVFWASIDLDNNIVPPSVLKSPK